MSVNVYTFQDKMYAFGRKDRTFFFEVFMW